MTIKVNSKEGKILGLSFIPTLEPETPDNHTVMGDYAKFRSGVSDNSEEVLSIIHDIVIKDSIKNILEIGVALYQEQYSMTYLISKHKNEDCKYLGIDIFDRSFIKKWSSNMHFLQENSHNQEKVREYLKEIGIEKLDLLIIDGEHSVNDTLNDWKYTDLLSDKGIVLIHDTNSHPGPIAVVSAIDRKMFKVEEPLKNKIDYGIAICSKI